LLTTTLFPYTTLFRSQSAVLGDVGGEGGEAVVDGLDVRVRVGDGPAGVPHDLHPPLAEGAVPLAVVVSGVAQRARQVAQVGDPLVHAGEDLLVGGVLRGRGPAAGAGGDREAGARVHLLALPGEAHGAPGRVELLAHRTRLLEPGLGPVR